MNMSPEERKAHNLARCLKRKKAVVSDERKEQQSQYFKNWYWALSPEARKAKNRISNQRRKERVLSAKSTQESPAMTQKEQGINTRIAELKKKSMIELCYIQKPKAKPKNESYYG